MQSAVRVNVLSKQIGFRKFWNIFNLLLNRDKTLVTTIINGSELIYPSSNKAKILPSIFTSNSTLDDKVHHLSDFPRLAEYDLSNIFITARKVLKFIKCWP